MPKPTTSYPAYPTDQAVKSPFKIFGTGPNNVFKVDISKAPLDPASKEKIGNLMGQITPNYGGQVALNAYEYNSSFAVATKDTKRVEVKFDNCQEKPQTPEGLFDGAEHFKNVPIPEGAVPAKGTDGAMTVWSPQDDALWEFWVAKQDASTKQWSACWGGRIDNVSQSYGTFPFPFGTSASGLATIGSAISIDEARRGVIDHALTLQLLEPANWDKVVFPANRSDGISTKPGALPMGTRLRLPATIKVDSLKITPLAKAVAKAAQKYGFIVTETAGAVAVPTESGQIEEERTGTDPWKQILGKTEAWGQLKGFPWDKLEAVQPGYLTPEDAPVPNQVAQ